MTAQQAPDELTWKRQPMGEWVTRHGFWVYTVFRDNHAGKGRQWVLEGYPEANMDDSQARTGFDTLKTAKYAALRTRCFRCGRWVPFGTLEKVRKGAWCCRDTGPCEAEQARQSAETRNFELEFRRTDCDEIAIREDSYGPQLVFRQAGHGTVVNVTEADLDKLHEVIEDRRSPLCCYRYGLGHDHALSVPGCPDYAKASADG